MASKKLELFKGKISDVKKQLLTNTVGSTKISTNPFTDRVSGSGSVETYHEYYTEFEIDGNQFRFDGDYTFKDGDNVALYAYRTKKGFYKVEILKNTTRNFFDNQLEKPSGAIRNILEGFGGGFIWGLLLVAILTLISYILGYLFGFDIDAILPPGSTANHITTIVAFCVICPLLGLWGAKISFQKGKKTLIEFKARVKEIEDYTAK